MPNPVTQVQTVQAINAALAQMVPPGMPIVDLNTNALSNANWSCNSFGPLVLEQICLITGTNPDNLQTATYARGSPNLPVGFANNTFVNISMSGDPSTLNHNFNILVSGGTTYLIQAFIDHPVNIVRRFPNATFIARWHDLSNNINWQAAYTTLFGVAPNVVVPNPPVATWLASQHVTQ
ncbi:hypothetical protein JY651_31445 [Pyxidicoccus parkwayensis]|uniref:Uncharacterized protein n=1 Tax=Pyxidicoccus parkwayensis TaxID=2813578 RepID=A0ABX7NLP8_9BACT|nr:hypothetical protein [Pyxidicoccus parkwaysis]QSQ19787.1 hypothetical protein JY651_31445 [Pyxidicoccus parkwaysis]